MGRLADPSSHSSEWGRSGRGFLSLNSSILKMGAQADRGAEAQSSPLALLSQPQHRAFGGGHDRPQLTLSHGEGAPRGSLGLDASPLAGVCWATQAAPCPLSPAPLRSRVSGRVSKWESLALTLSAPRTPLCPSPPCSARGLSAPRAGSSLSTPIVTTLQ